MPKHTKRGGLATFIALAALAVIAAASIIVLKSATTEKRFDSSAFRMQQAETLADDLYRIAGTQKKDISLTIPASAYHGIADLQLTATVRDNVVSASAAYTGKLPEYLQYRTERKQEVP
jgi:cytochrome c-type biogenesis protein CcmE